MPVGGRGCPVNPGGPWSALRPTATPSLFSNEAWLASRSPIAKREDLLWVFALGLGVELFVEKARLNVAIVLVLVALIFRDFADDLVIENLADRHARID